MMLFGVELTTREEMSRGFEELGIQGHALDALLRETAATRHNQRVLVAMAAARDFVHGMYEDLLGREFVDLLAAAICAADQVGIGGPGGCSGNSTARHPAFKYCGKGRKNARDGGAWSAAIEEARKLLDPCLTFAVNNGAMFVQSGRDSGEIEKVIPREWAYTLARDGLRRAAGMRRWNSLRFEAFEDNARQWAEVVNNLAPVEAADVILLI